MFESLFAKAASILLPVLVAVAGGFVRMVYDEKPISVWRVVRYLIIAVFIGLVASATLDYMDISQNIRYACVAIAAIVSEDIISGFIRLGKMFKEDPSAIIPFFRRK